MRTESRAARRKARCKSKPPPPNCTVERTSRSEHRRGTRRKCRVPTVSLHSAARRRSRSVYTVRKHLQNSIRERERVREKRGEGRDKRGGLNRNVRIHVHDACWMLERRAPVYVRVQKGERRVKARENACRGVREKERRRSARARAALPTTGEGEERRDGARTTFPRNLTRSSP